MKLLERGVVGGGSQGELTDGEADVGCTAKVAGEGAVHCLRVIFIGRCMYSLPAFLGVVWFGWGWYRYRWLTKGIGTPAARTVEWSKYAKSFVFGRSIKIT